MGGLENVPGRVLRETGPGIHYPSTWRGIDGYRYAPPNVHPLFRDSYVAIGVRFIERHDRSVRNGDSREPRDDRIESIYIFSGDLNLGRIHPKSLIKAGQNRAANAGSIWLSS